MSIKRISVPEFAIPNYSLPEYALPGKFAYIEKDITATLVLDQTVLVGITKTVDDTLVLDQTVLVGITKTVDDTLVLDQTVLTNIIKPISNTLVLDQTVLVYKNILRQVSNTLILNQCVKKDNINSLHNVLIISHNSRCILINKYIQLVLQTPYSDTLSTIYLPKPLFDDSEGIITDLLLKKSMSNRTRTLIKRTKNKGLNYTLSLDRAKGILLKSFIDSYKSDYIKLQNWKGEEWKVRLVTNPIEYVISDRHGTTEVNLVFEGIRV